MSTNAQEQQLRITGELRQDDGQNDEQDDELPPAFHPVLFRQHAYLGDPIQIQGEPAAVAEEPEEQENHTHEDYE